MNKRVERKCLHTPIDDSNRSGKEIATSAISVCALPTAPFRLESFLLRPTQIFYVSFAVCIAVYNLSRNSFLVW